MAALLTALEAVIPTFLLIAVGALADRWLPSLNMETLTRLSVYVLIPALVFETLAATALPIDQASRLALAYVAYLAVLGVAAALSARGLPAAAARALIACSLFGNSGNMGLPITLFAYGSAGLERAVVIFVASTLVMFALAPPLLAGGRIPWGQRLRQALLLPPLWAAVLGIGANLAQFGMPLVIERSVGVLGGAAIPIMLLSLGLQMRRNWVWNVSGTALRATAVRLLVGPPVAALVALALALPALDRNVLILGAAMPVAVTMFVLAVEVEGDYASVARTVVAMTVASALAITAVIALLPPS